MPVAGTVDSPDAVGFLISCIFEFHQLSSLPMKHEGGATLCADLLGLTEQTKSMLIKFDLGPFLERNDEKRVSILLPMVRSVWAILKPEILLVECADGQEVSSDSDGSLESDANDSDYSNDDRGSDSDRIIRDWADYEEISETATA